MYDLKQFRPILYLVLAMGLTGFTLAVEVPGLWVLGLLVLGFHAWLVRTGRFRPLPRLVANGVTILALVYTFQAVRTQPTPIITIGQFLVFLQLVKLFELRANRDYAQLLVLSLLLMVAGAISTASLAFAVLFVCYLFAALYCCLLFHLKTENDLALAAQSLPPERLNDATVKQDQRYLPRSMKKLAGAVALVAITMAVAVFLFFPRGAGAGMFGQMSFRPSQALTGFSDDASLGAITRIQQNTETVANVQVLRGEGWYDDSGRTLYLRGRTFDLYDRSIGRWERTEPPFESLFGGRNNGDHNTSGGTVTRLARTSEIPADGEKFVYRISLRPTGARAIFAPANPITLTPGRDLGKVHYARSDNTIAAHAEVFSRLDYEVESRRLSPDDDLIQIAPSFRNVSRAFKPPVARTPGPAPVDSPESKSINLRVAEYARRPDVSGDSQDPNLAAQRPRDVNIHDLDERIASNIQRHLLTTFKYTLDLPGTVSIDPNRDYVEQFLYDWKVGHCEYFAYAMTLMCQSLGMEARVVTGFKCDEYDKSMGHYYIVRQSHAHAWVEVRTKEGWRRFDPTSGNEVGGGSDQSAWQSIRHFFAFLDYKWATSVVAYDSDRRDNLVSSLDRRLINTVVNSRLSPTSISRSISDWFSGLFESVNRWLDGRGGWSPADSVRLLCTVAGAIVAVLFFRRSLKRWRMRRRARRIGLEALPTSEQIRLARQLGFYERLTRLLERHRIIRPAHQTPREFGDSLTFLPTAAFEAVSTLTAAFYAVRFGDQTLPAETRKELEAAVDTLDPLLAGVPAVQPK